MKILTIQEACEALHVSERTLSRWRKSRRIGYFKIGGRVLFTQESVDSIIAKHSIKSIV